MKAISIAACIAVTMAMSMSACATPDMTPDQQKVRPITEPDKCEFLKTAYFEVSHPSKVHFYAAKNVVEAGGDSYQIMNSGKDAAVGVQIFTTTIGIYRCNK
ncbi:MAG: hypothetical protein ABIQ70_07075 [Dokdonella sp.]